MDFAEITSSRLTELFKELRLAKNMSHEDLAVKAGLDRSTISLYESGKRNPTVISALRVAKALDVSLAKVLREAERGG
jgi:transcriptional regulator with XRE-family HTH domain